MDTNPVNVEEETSDDSIEETEPPTQTQSQNQAQSQGVESTVRKKRKKRKMTSDVWNYFDILPKQPNEPLMCECKKCGRKYQASSKYGTGNLLRHQKTCIKTTTKDIGSNEASTRQVDGEGGSNDSIYEEFDEFDGSEDGPTKKSHLQVYLLEPRTRRTTNINILEFWKVQQYRYPELARMAMDILCVPVSTVASESAFSLGGRILDQYRSSMTPSTVEAVICARDWLFGLKDKFDVDLEEMTQNVMSMSMDEGITEASLSNAL